MLGKLKDFNEVEIQLFDKLLYCIFIKGWHVRFNPNIYKRCNIELNEKNWLNFLEILVRENVLNVQFELMCANCSKSFKIYTKIAEIPLGQEILDDFCGESFKIESDDVFITYSFKENLISNYSGESESLPNSNEKKKNGLFTLTDYSQYPELNFQRTIEENENILLATFKLVKKAKTTQEKGDSLEKFGKLFLVSPYFIFRKIKERTRSGEVDIIFEVKQFQGTIFNEFNNILLVECKNWKANIPTKEVRIFSTKMMEAGANVGIILSKSQITGDKNLKSESWGYIKSLWDNNKWIIINFTEADIVQVLTKKKNLYKILCDKYYEVKNL